MTDRGADPRTLADLAAEVRAFAVERDWRQFHDPKSLALALVGEVGELAELLQWVPADQAATIFSAGERHTRMGEELADILVYLVTLADVVGIDLTAAAFAKLAAARAKFPVAAYQGVAPTKA